ncbi:hypothetical protein V1511DRAFT_492041 [Dipodascopsis uninucleata]
MRDQSVPFQRDPLQDNLSQGRLTTTQENSRAVSTVIGTVSAMSGPTVSPVGQQSIPQSVPVVNWAEVEKSRRAVISSQLQAMRDVMSSLQVLDPQIFEEEIQNIIRSSSNEVENGLNSATYAPAPAANLRSSSILQGSLSHPIEFGPSASHSKTMPGQLISGEWTNNPSMSYVRNPHLLAIRQLPAIPYANEVARQQSMVTTTSQSMNNDNNSPITDGEPIILPPILNRALIGSDNARQNIEERSLLLQESQLEAHNEHSYRTADENNFGTSLSTTRVSVAQKGNTPAQLKQKLMEVNKSLKNAHLQLESFKDDEKVTNRIVTHMKTIAEYRKRIIEELVRASNQSVSVPANGLLEYQRSSSVELLDPQIIKRHERKSITKVSSNANDIQVSRNGNAELLRISSSSPRAPSLSEKFETMKQSNMELCETATATTAEVLSSSLTPDITIDVSTICADIIRVAGLSERKPGQLNNIVYLNEKLVPVANFLKSRSMIHEDLKHLRDTTFFDVFDPPHVQKRVKSNNSFHTDTIRDASGSVPTDATRDATTTDDLAFNISTDSLQRRISESCNEFDQATSNTFGTLVSCHGASIVEQGTYLGAVKDADSRELSTDLINSTESDKQVAHTQNIKRRKSALNSKSIPRNSTTLVNRYNSGGRKSEKELTAADRFYKHSNEEELIEAFPERGLLISDHSQKAKFKIYRCLWSRCGCELHSNSTLMRHIKKNHLQMDGRENEILCAWKACSDSRSRKFRCTSKEEMIKHLCEEHIDSGFEDKMIASALNAFGDQAKSYIQSMKKKLVTPLAFPAKKGQKLGFPNVRESYLNADIPNRLKIEISRLAEQGGGAGFESDSDEELVTGDHISSRKDRLEVEDGSSISIENLFYKEQDTPGNVAPWLSLSDK